MDTFKQLQKKVSQFSEERNWSQFHSAKNLCMALSVEVSELLEIFQWKTAEESDKLNAADKQAAAEEIADVQIYLLQVASRLDIDIQSAVTSKMMKNAEKYPATGVTVTPSSRVKHRTV
jgi:NTP pyrophosphatase (non-canonical NTP hydrolase)